MSDCRGLAMLLPIALMLGVAPAFGQDDEADAVNASASEATPFDATPQSCISMSRVRHTEVIDDYTVLFVSRSGSGYVNVLEMECPTLRENGLFRYRVNSGIRTARLCDSQAITVIDRVTNSLTHNCRLGSFYPVSKEQVQLLRNPGLSEPVEVTTIEVPPDDTPSDAGGADE